MNKQILGRRQALFLVLCLGLLVIGLGVSPRDVSAAPCTTTVPAGGDIQAAINVASPDDVICLSAGTYTPAATLVIPIPLTLQGPQFDVDPRPSAGSTRTPGGPSEAIIDGGGTLSTIIQITSSYVALEGFEVTNGTGDLILSPDGADITGVHVAYLIVHDSTEDEGMQLKDCDSCLIEYNYVYDTVGDAINLCCGSAGGMIQYNETKDIDSENAAIYVYEAEGTTVYCNFIDGTSRNDGIKIGDKNGGDAQKEGGSVYNNTITNTAQDGIAVYMSGTFVGGNDISYSSSENGAVYVTHGVTNIFIFYNNIHDNAFSTDKGQPGGVTVGNSGNQLASDVRIYENNFTGNNPNAVLNLAPDLLNAELNWWGDASGPGPAGTGSGDGVSANVDFDPWLAQPVDIPPARCGSPGTITVVKSAAGGGTTKFQFDQNWGPDPDYTFFLADGESLTSPPLQSGDYTVSERLPLPDGWSLESASCDNMATDPIESIDPGFYFIVENGDEWVCTFTNVYTPSQTYFFSAKTPGTVDGVAFGSEDVLLYDGTTWSKWFDGSDAMLNPKKTYHNIDAISIPDPLGDDLFISFTRNERPVPGINGIVDGMDVVHWDGTAFSLLFDGQDAGLEILTRENVDALHVLPGSEWTATPDVCLHYLLISTKGPGNVPANGGNLKFSGEDVLGFCLTQAGADTTGLWTMVLDGSTVGMNKNSTDSISLSADGSTMYLTTLAKFTVNGVLLGNKSMVYTYDIGTQIFSSPIFVAPAAGLTKDVDGLHVSD